MTELPTKPNSQEGLTWLQQEERWWDRARKESQAKGTKHKGTKNAYECSSHLTRLRERKGLWPAQRQLNNPTAWVAPPSEEYTDHSGCVSSNQPLSLAIQMSTETQNSVNEKLQKLEPWKQVLLKTADPLLQLHQQIISKKIASRATFCFQSYHFFYQEKRE